MKKLLLALIRFYRRRISPLTRSRCRFVPSCSEYAYEAIMEYGVIQGSFLTVKRIAKCGPWSQGGYDPLPKRQHMAGSNYTGGSA